MTQFDDSISPWSRAEDVAHVGDCVAEDVPLVIILEEWSDCAACPGRSLLEELFYYGDCCAEIGWEGFDGRQLVFGSGGDDLYVPGD